MAITQTELSSILAEVEQDLRKAHDVEVERLSKGFPPGKDESPAGAPPEATDSSSPADESASSAPEAPPAPDASASPAGAPPDASAAPAPGMDPAAGTPEGQAPMTPEALQAEYAQLPPEELDMHIQAALAAKEALSGAAGAPPADASAAPGGMPPGAPEGSMPPPAAMKGEIKVDKEAIGGPSTMKSEPSEFVALAKSQEKLIKALVEAQGEKDSKIQGLTEDVENLTKAITMVVGKPMRKSIANLSEITVAEKTSKEVAPMAKSEVYKLVGDNADKLTKSERDLWLGFIDNKVPAAKLAPMLERLTSQK
jgi:hypothetical protein